MSLNTQIKQEALEIANDLLQSAQRLKPELRQIETRKAQVEAILENTNRCHERAANFRPEIAGDFQCPNCWIRNDVKSSLKPIEGTATVDYFKCPHCDYRTSYAA